jgi:hypothetical protein
MWSSGAPIDDHHLPNPLPQAALNQQRHIKHAHFLASQPQPNNCLRHHPAYSGMHDLIQPLPLRFIIEDNRAELLPVQVPVRKEHGRTKRGDDAGEAPRSWSNCLTRKDVGVDDRDVVRAGEEARNGRLACRNSACETDDWSYSQQMRWSAGWSRTCLT